MATSDQITNNAPYKAADIEAAYKAIYGGLPASMMDKNGNLAAGYEDGIYPGSVLTTPTGQQIDSSQLMYMYQAGKQAAAQSTAPAATSYLSAASPTTQSAPMANSVTPQQAVQYYVSQGGDSRVDPNTAMSYYTAMNPGASAPSGPSPQNALGISQITQRDGNTMLQNAAGNQIWVDGQGNYFNMDAAGNKTPVSDQAAVQMGFQGANPETQALRQMGQIDPATEALRGQLAGSYLDPNTAANPTASDYQKYLDTFKQVDPAEYAARAGLGTSMDAFLKSQQDQYNLGSQLDPVTQMQVEQQARAAQAARGNLYGSGQAAVEAMTTGQAGQALQQQRTQNMQAALGGQQSYLGAGLGLGDTAMQLYQQGLQNKANAQQSALSYLSSGQTPYQAGASYLDRANANAATAAQGGPVYNPAALGAGQLGTAQQAPQYGLDVGAQAQNYFNSLNNAYGSAGAATKNKGAAAAQGALTGALGGASAGATLGSVIPGVGTVIGGVVGGVAGGALGAGSGYYS